MKTATPREDARAWRAAGLEALRRGKPGHALRAFDRALGLGADVDLVGVLRARALAEAGDRSAAVAALLAIGRAGHTDARVEAARELSFLGLVPDALSIAEEVLIVAPRHRAALELTLEAARLGWVHETARAFERALQRTAGDRALRLRAAAFHESLREPERALEHVALALAGDPTDVEAWLLRARCAAASGRREEAFLAASRAEALSPHESSRLREVALVRLEAGDPAGAERTLRRALERAPRDLETVAWLAELALHRLALDDAEALAADALSLSPDLPRALSVRGAARVLRGDPAGGLGDLERAAAAEDATALHWLGEAQRRLGRFDDAVATLDLAVVRATRYAVTAHASRLLALLEQNAGVHDGTVDPDAHEELVHALTPLAGAPSPEVIAGRPAPVADHLRRALDALGGNRSSRITRLDGNASVPIVTVPNSRTAARYQQERLRSRSIEEVLEGFDALLVSYGDRPPIHCHRGEVYLWLGRYAEAAACFERALGLDRRTRWAWIGLGASALGAGDPAAAQRAFDDALVEAPPPGRTIHVYRGELALRRGEIGAAREDLERSLSLNPERISASLLLALALLAAGEGERGLGRIARARAAAPGLFHDVDRAQLGGSPEHAARGALTLMRGNRSAGFVTYFTHAGDLRFVPSVRAGVLAP